VLYDFHKGVGNERIILRWTIRRWDVWIGYGWKYFRIISSGGLSH